MAEAQGVSVVIDDDTGEATIDPLTGTVSTPQADGSVIVQLDARRPKAADDDENKFYQNLADDIDRIELGKIANDLCDAVAADERSRSNYLEIRKRGLDLMGLELKEPRANVGDQSAAVEGMSTVTNPLLLEACLKGWANAHAELLPSTGPAKVSNKGEEDEVEGELAESFERDLNYWFTDTAVEYYPDTSHMLLWGTYAGGSGFKKIYRCPMRRRPVSESVSVQDFIVSDTMKDLRACSRITHQISMRPSVMKRMKFLGAYRDTKNTPQPTPTPNVVDEKVAAIQGTQAVPQRTEDQPYTIWETQCELDLPQYAPGKFKNEGIPLPYLVTIDKDAKEILAIRRDWREDDEDCERKRMYVKYPYVPGPGFYGTGLVNILGNSSAALTAVWRETLDAGMFANFPGGVIQKLGGRQNTSDFRMAPGTFTPIETNGQPIGNVIMPSPYKDITPGLLALLDKIQQQTAPLGGAADIPTAEGVQNVPVGTMLAQIEQATKVMAAAHKGMHHAQAEEIFLIVELFREKPEDFWSHNKVCPKEYWNDEKFLKALEDCDLVPASDPNTPSHIHRVAKAVGLAQLFQIPQFAARLSVDEALTRILAAMREDPNGLLLPPAAPAPPQPDPQIIAASAKMITAQTGQFKASSEAQNMQTQADIKRSELNAEQNIKTVDLAKEMIIHKSDAALAQNKQAGDAMHAAKTHALDVGQAAHDQNMDVAEHALNVHQALNPPEPKATSP